MDSVTFVAPPSSWDLTYDGFKEALVAQAVQKYAHIHLKIHDGYWIDGLQKFISSRSTGAANYLSLMNRFDVGI